MSHLSRKSKPALFSAFAACAAAAVLAGLLSGCHLFHRKTAEAATATKRVALASLPLPLDLKKVQPNEAGLVPILEYHDLINSGKATDYQYPAAEFRKDLEWLYAHNYRPISLSDYARGKIDCPAGTSPVILTFDDALLGQFNYTADNKIDPNCAVGILDDFHAKHPDWAQKGTFFVLTDEDPKLPAPFSTPRRRGVPDQTALAQGKMEYLVREGYEIGNHTVHHLPGMRHWPDSRVQAEFAGAVAGIHKYLPHYDVQTLALPFGIFPKNKKLLAGGQSGGVAYHNLCALDAGWMPAPSPMAKKINLYRLPRIIPGDRHSKPGSLHTIRWWLAEMERNKTDKYISDGDPHTYTVNAVATGRINAARLKKSGFLLRTYNGTQMLASK